MSFITSIGTATPPYRLKQSALASFMVRAMNPGDEGARKIESLYRATGIDTRYSVLPDYGRENGFEFYSNRPDFEPFPSTADRIRLFKQHALTLSLKAIQDCLSSNHFATEKVTHLIVVSCTGMYAPGLDIDIVKALGLKSSVSRTCIHFMGCYAAFNAIKLADVFCKTESDAKVLIVCTELCSIHFQKANTEDNLLANALFADGSAAVLVEATAAKGWNFTPQSFYCDLVPEGEKDMSWQIGDFGFEMRLSAYVPTLIKKGIAQLTAELMKKVSGEMSHVNYFAIHPGGRRILDVVEKELEISSDKNRFSRHVLRNFGNMSSPTVLFVLKEIWQQLGPNDQGQKILSFAFGPGLTLESMLLNITFRKE